MRGLRFGAWIGIALWLASGAGGDTPRIYKWVDENGIAHYTADPETIPRNLRDRFVPLRERPKIGREEAVPVAPDGVEADTLGTTDSESWSVRDAPLVPAAPPAASPDPPLETAASTTPAEATRIAALDTRIAEVEASIARDEEILKALVSRVAEADEPLADEPEFREIARRLPQLQADLKTLREERGQLEAP